ncbi:TolC family protein [Emticicia sp. BO119]|uniref:TolC family protein n=1 Tax=Emticicia sp. BO119 TaxID=2757768 RepID=UPI0015EFE0DE|nr:TolC family protein [Emticicia sp. BO119]MBA4851085.1 TolC family protein [Emticicia sp. BO119]
MTRVILSFILGFTVSATFAQTLTLEQAVQKGLENRIELKSQNLNLQIASAENEKVKAKWLPQVSGNADIRWNTQLQTTVLPFALPGSGESQTEVKLGRPFNNSFMLQAEQKVYDANRKVDRAVNDTQVEAQKNTLEQIRINVRQAITEAYYNSVFAKEKLSLSALALQRANSYFEVGKARFDQGAILKNDLDKLELDVSNAKLAQTKNQQDYDLSLIAFQYQLNTTDTVEPAEDLQAIFNYSQITDNQSNIERRTELKAEELNLRLNQLNMQKQLARNKPMVSAYGNYSYFQLAETLNPFEKGTWFPANYIGIRANVPIFDGRQARLAANDFKVRQQINTLNAERLRNDFGYESKSTWNTLQQSKLNLEEAKKNIALAQRILETDKFRFEKGVILLSDLKNTEYSLQSAENQYLSSIYNFLIASVRYKKASGNL